MTDFLGKLLKQRNAIETPTGQVFLEMMREYSEEQSFNKNVNSDKIVGMQMMIQHIKGAKIRFEEEKARNGT